MPLVEKVLSENFAGQTKVLHRGARLDGYLVGVRILVWLLGVVVGMVVEWVWRSIDNSPVGSGRATICTDIELSPTQLVVGHGLIIDSC